MRLAEIARFNKFVAATPVLNETDSASAQLRSIVREMLQAIDEATRVRGDPNPSRLLQDWEKGPTSDLFHVPRSEQVDHNRLRQGLQTIGSILTDFSFPGLMLCTDEGHRIVPGALSALKLSFEPAFPG